MNPVLQFLRDAGTFYLATTEEGLPRVRPFGAVSEFEGKLYICTNNRKKVFQQLTANAHFEISAVLNGEWIRLCGKAVQDSRKQAKAAMLEQNPGLNNLYSLDDGIFEVFCLQNAKASILSFSGKNESFEF